VPAGLALPVPVRAGLVPAVLAGLALLLLAGPALVAAQEQPLAAGTDNVPVPKKKKHVQPTYPQEALAEGIRGIVILDLVIDTEGRVVEIHTIRSIPGLDEAALAAARQWRYQPVKVDGKLVSVRLTVPITFALKLPDISRAQGIPELRQGVTPPWPEAGAGGRGGKATADVTLDPDGRIGLARIIHGEEPWSTSLLQALRTWRFRAPPIDTSLSFEIEAEFVPSREKGTVKLHLTSLRETTLFDSPEPEEPPAIAVLEPALAGEPTPAALDKDPTPETKDAPAEGEDREPPAEQAPVAPEAASGPTPETPARVAEAAPEPPGAAQPSSAPNPAEAVPPAAPAAAPTPAAVPSAPPGGVPPEATGGLAEGADPTAPPPIEVLTAAPPPLPPENGISAIRGVLLEPGVPDLTRGRRPVSPPFARMAAVQGVVEVEFSVGSGGLTAVQRVNGPELLQPAATQAVESWIFRRTRADRAYLLAVFTYEDDLSSAVVRPQPR
jgi:TonB family protein